MGLALTNSTMIGWSCPVVKRPQPSTPAVTTSANRSWSQVWASRKLTKPGPATSTAVTCGGGSVVSASARAVASSRGLRPAALAVANAALVDQSPWSGLDGRST